MFSQIIDLLVKQDDERRRILFLLLKITFTSTLAAQVYISFYGNYRIIPVTNFQEIILYFINGMAIKCLAIFTFIWIISYNIPTFFISIPILWLTAKIYSGLKLILNVKKEDVLDEHLKDNAGGKVLRFFINLYNSTDIIEYENNDVKPGRLYYKFLEYLEDLKSGKKHVEPDRFSDPIFLVIQFIVIYFWLNFDFLSYSYWILVPALLIMINYLLLSCFGFVIATLIENKHSRLLILLRQITPEFQNHNKPLELDQQNIT